MSYCILNHEATTLHAEYSNVVRHESLSHYMEVFEKNEEKVCLICIYFQRYLEFIINQDIRRKYEKFSRSQVYLLHIFVISFPCHALAKFTQLYLFHR